MTVRAGGPFPINQLSRKSRLVTVEGSLRAGGRVVEQTTSVVDVENVSGVSSVRNVTRRVT